MSKILEELKTLQREYIADAASASKLQRQMRAACVMMLDDLKPHVRQKTVALQAGISPSRISEIKRGVYRMPNLPAVFSALLTLWETHCMSQSEQRRVNASKTTDWIGGGQ